MIEAWMWAVLFAIAAIFGLRGSVRVTRRYLAVRDQLDSREALILILLAFICWVITVAIGYFGFLTVRQLLGFERLPGLLPVSALITILVLLIPAVIDAVVDRVARVPWS